MMKIDADELVRRVNSGTSYQTIATEHGVSRQYIAQCYAVAARNTGRLAFMGESRTESQLRDRRMRDVEQNGKYIPPSFWDAVRNGQDVPRDDQIVASLLSGQSLKQTAARFGVSYQRVSQIWAVWVHHLPVKNGGK